MTTTEPRTERGTHQAQREHVAALHTELTCNRLVTWTSGNVSERVPGEDLFVIKGSGVLYDELTWEGITVCDLDGNAVDGVKRPSSDTDAHAYVYRHMPEVNGQVHTHSAYATACAARWSRGTTRRPATRRRTRTSTGTCRTSAGSYTRTARTPPPGRPAASRSPARSPRWPTSSAGTSRWGRSR